MNPENLQFVYGDEEIAFRLERRRRRTLAISVKPDLTIEVVAPLDTPLEKVFAKVKKRARWIRKQVRFFVQFQPRTPERRYVGGRANERLKREFSLITLPVLILHGTADKTTVPGGSHLFHETVGSKDKTIKLYEGHFHDLLNDLGKEQVMADIVAWIEARLP